MVLDYASYLVDNGHEVLLEANIIDTVFPINGKIKIIPINYKGSIGTLLSAFLKKRIADLVIADIIPLACALYVRNRKKVVYFAQDYNVTHYSNPLMKFVVVALNYLGLAIFRIRTIAVSDELSCTLSDNFKARIEKVITNGVNTSLFYPAPSDAFKTEKNGRRSILILARNDQRKGFDIAQKVVEKVLDSCSLPIVIWTVGDTAEGKFAGAAHRDFGYVSEHRLREILSSADVFLYPSRSEGCPLMVMEAYACRCPVVTTTAVSYASHESNAMVSPVEDVDSLTANVCKLLESPDVSQRITTNAYAFVQEHPLGLARRAFKNALENLDRNNDMESAEQTTSAAKGAKRKV